MKFKIIIILLLLCSCTNNKFHGHVYDYDTEKPIENVAIHVNGKTAKTDSTGYFSIKIKSSLQSVITFKREGYFDKKIYRKPDSLGKLSKEKINWNRIYLYNKDTDFYSKRRL